MNKVDSVVLQQEAKATRPPIAPLAMWCDSDKDVDESGVTLHPSFFTFHCSS